jgi:polysaccharide deacetylase 2 family uncharacterized protein YibQ
MATDDLSAPLGQHRKKRHASIRLPIPQIIAGALALFLAIFVFWAVMGENPFGGEPVAVIPIQTQAGTPAKIAEGDKNQPVAAAKPEAPGGPGRYDGPRQAPPAVAQIKEAVPPGSTTVNIINGATGTRQEVVIPGPGSSAAPPPPGPTVDPKFLEMTPLGPLPKIAADGVRPADAFAQPVRPIPGKPDAVRIALIIDGLGVSAKDTAEAIAKLPGAVTLAFVPYGSDAALAGRARAAGHEVLLEVPMEPFDYPDNDTGPETLLTSLAPHQNLDRLHWLMARFQGYVGLINMMGARFTASEQSFAPVLQEAEKRGLIFVDDGSNPRSVAGRLASSNNLPFAKADVTIDSVATPDQIERALAGLEMTARQHRLAVGVASALPVSIAHIAKWAKTAASRGVVLVPITAAVTKEKQS